MLIHVNEANIHVPVQDLDSQRGEGDYFQGDTVHVHVVILKYCPVRMRKG